jgi:hypothetical protein
MLLPVLCTVVVALLSTSPCQGRKHYLQIQNDVRQSIPLSTFGFYTGGLEGIFFTSVPSDQCFVSESALIWHYHWIRIRISVNKIGEKFFFNIVHEPNFS